MVTILVAVYNGEKYLADLLDSLLNQTYKDIRIVVSDDKSSDKSAEIIKNYYEKYTDKIIPIFRDISCGSAKAHFMALLESFQDSEYVMFCDQDDVWFSDKVEKTLKLMQEGENESPRLVHTDAAISDEKLNITHKSLKAFSSIPKNLSFRKLLGENNVQGASAMMNSALIKLAVPYDENIVMHDRWVALIAAAIGETKYLDEPTLLYRQHSKNEIGANIKPNSFEYIKKRLKTDIKGDINLSRRQAGVLVDRIGDKMPRELKKAAENYALSENLSKLQRLKVMKNENIFPDAVLNKIKFILWG